MRRSEGPAQPHQTRLPMWKLWSCLVKKRRRQFVGITNHKSDGHGFTQRSAQAQHDTTHNTRLGVGQHNLGHHFPSGATNAIGRLF